MKASYLSKTETAKLLERFKNLEWLSNILEEKIKTVFRIELEELSIYKIGGTVLIERSGLLFPTLREELSGKLLEKLPCLVVDMGAVPHIVNGADIMRPGVKRVKGDFKVDSIFVVRDEKNMKPLAIVKTLISYEEFKSMTKGKVAENLHYVNDKIWSFLEEFRSLLER